MYEVEQKFPIDDAAVVRDRLVGISATPGRPIEQVDRYFAHPSRDFAKTDEALRIRRVGEQNFVTYKGPKIDPQTKTRREIELPIPPGENGASAFGDLLAALSFEMVAEVRKTRTTWTLEWDGHQVSIAVDDVDRLGAFVELEIVADESELDPAQRALASLAETLQLSGSERQSYLELLLGAR